MIKHFTLLLSIFILHTSQSQAQVDSTAAKNELIDSICTCISNIDSNQVNSPSAAQNMLISCVYRYEDLMKKYVLSTGMDSTDLNENTGPKIAQYIAQEVYNNCTYLRALVKKFKVQSD